MFEAVYVTGKNKARLIALKKKKGFEKVDNLVDDLLLRAECNIKATDVCDECSGVVPCGMCPLNDFFKRRSEGKGDNVKTNVDDGNGRTRMFEPKLSTEDRGRRPRCEDAAVRSIN